MLLLSEQHAYQYFISVTFKENKCKILVEIDMWLLYQKVTCRVLDSQPVECYCHFLNVNVVDQPGRAWQPTPVLQPGESHGLRSLVGYSPQGHKSWTRLKHLSMCACDREAWRAVVHGVAKSQMQLNDSSIVGLQFCVRFRRTAK